MDSNEKFFEKVDLKENYYGYLNAFISNDKKHLKKYLQQIEVEESFIEEIVSRNFTTYSVLSNLYVKEYKREQGIGQRLLGDYLDECVLKKVEFIILSAKKYNYQNPYSLQDFYENFGFKCINDDHEIMIKEHIFPTNAKKHYELARLEKVAKDVLGVNSLTEEKDVMVSVKDLKEALERAYNVGKKFKE